VTIKRVEGGRASNYLRDNLKPGDEIEVLPPMGNFTVDIDPNHSNNYILIGAGSGITPLMSILKSVLFAEPDSVVTLWFCNRDEDNIIFADELETLEEKYPDRLTVVHSLTKPSENWKGAVGRLDTDRIYELVSDLFMIDEHRKVYYLCGPNGLMDAAERALEKHAVNLNDVHREYYSAPAPTDEQVAAAYTTSSNGHTKEIEGYKLETQKVIVELDNQQYTLTVEPDKCILDAAIEANLDPPYACQSGICTTCRAMLKSGVVLMDESEGLSEDEIEDGFILTCQSHPLTDDVEVEYG
jgi:ring-1,2-phenylacetyl-CoA epoxidase subunit PaaE